MTAADHVVFMSVVVLILLFLFQRCGTSKVSFTFSPIMLLWLATNASIGIYNIFKYYPSILKALSPHYIVIFTSRNAKTLWNLLGAVFLGITGTVLEISGKVYGFSTSEFNEFESNQNSEKDLPIKLHLNFINWDRSRGHVC